MVSAGLPFLCFAHQYSILELCWKFVSQGHPFSLASWVLVLEGLSSPLRCGILIGYFLLKGIFLTASMIPLSTWATFVSTCIDSIVCYFTEWIPDSKVFMIPLKLVFITLERKDCDTMCLQRLSLPTTQSQISYLFFNNIFLHPHRCRIRVETYILILLCQEKNIALFCTFNSLVLH